MNKKVGFLLSEKRFDFIFEFYRIFHFTFPDCQSPPAFGFIKFEILFVSGDVSKAFGLPVFDIGFRCHASAFAVVHMPETAVNENDFFMSRQNDVGFAGKFFVVKPETKAETVND